MNEKITYNGLKTVEMKLNREIEEILEGLLDERCELYKKTKKLKYWLRSMSYKTELEREQFNIMEKYLEILDKRIVRCF